MGYYSFDLSSLLSPRTSVCFHKKLKITREGIKAGTNARDSGPNSRIKVCKLKCKCRPNNWITCSL